MGTKCEPKRALKCVTYVNPISGFAGIYIILPAFFPKDCV